MITQLWCTCIGLNNQVEWERVPVIKVTKRFVVVDGLDGNEHLDREQLESTGFCRGYFTDKGRESTS